MRRCTSGPTVVACCCRRVMKPPRRPVRRQSILPRLNFLAQKVSLHVPGWSDLAIRRSWACLRTFAPDRHPVIGADRRLPGLFHVAGLGGFGMMCSAAVGELAAALLTGTAPDWIDVTAVASSRSGVPRVTP